MAELSSKERDALGAGDFAVPGKRLLPIHDAAHARLAAAMVDRTQGLTDAERAEAKKRIAARLKEFGGDGKGERVELPEITRAAGVEHILALPITRIDEARREVEAVATSEATDTFRTAFDYEASKAAFSRWYGNVREMHAPKAVGRKVDVRFDDAARQIVVRSRISEGASDTWAKVIDGTLSGYSIGGSNAVWEPVPVEKRAQGGPERICTSYDLVELSLVDNPSNPDARGLTVVRAEAVAGDVFADLEPAGEAAEADPATPDPTVAAEAPATEERASRTISAATSAKIHGMRDHGLAGARGAMDTCGCEECGALAKLLDPDGDGDVDIPGSALDTDGDAGAMDRAAVAMVARVFRQQIEPMARELAALRAAEETRNQHPEGTGDTERLQAISGELGKVSTVLTAVEARLGRIEEQPVGGGPVVRAVPGLTAADKALNGAAVGGGGADRVAVLTDLARNTSDQSVQTFLAAEIMRASGTFERR